MRKMMNKFLKLLVDNTILLILIVGTDYSVFNALELFSERMSQNDNIS